MLAILRPDSWNFPLFLHVLGAMVVTGATAAAFIGAVASRRWPWLRLVVARTLFLATFPAWLLMRLAGQWIDSKENIPGDPGWLGVGFLVGDAGFVRLAKSFKERSHLTASFVGGVTAAGCTHWFARRLAHVELPGLVWRCP